jgi:hypothetical protein
MKIQKSTIQSVYQQYLQSGIDDWSARTSVIESIINIADVEDENYVEPQSPEYYFAIQTIWNLCDS